VALVVARAGDGAKATRGAQAAVRELLDRLLGGSTVSR
jgi:hypothetical protein